MTKTLHTAAPWHVDFVDTDMVYAANGLRVATTYCDGQDEMPWEEIEANASLVAAAPDLLEAAELATTLCALITQWAEAERDDAFDIMDEIVGLAQDNEQPAQAVTKAKRQDHHYPCDQCGCVHHADFIGHDKADA